MEDMARFTCMILKGKNDKQIMIITAYRVCKSGPNIEPHTAHMQQVKQMLLKGIIIPNARIETLLELQQLVKEHHKQGKGVVLMMDANEDWEKEKDGELAEFLLATQLEDVHQAR